MAEELLKHFEIDGLAVPVRIYREWRNSMRISIGAKVVHLRIPKGVIPGTTQRALLWADEWLNKKYLTNPELFARFRTKSYRDGEHILTALKSYVLRIQYRDRKTMKGTLLLDKYVTLVIPNGHSIEAVSPAMGALISRVIGQDQYDWVLGRLQRIQEAHFPETTLGTIRLKYNTSNWGSCSSKGNINLSTRLLLAPVDVLDYVIIHELTHLIHPNHSKAFWARVAQVMPEYKQKERWLSENNHLCFF